MTNVTCADSSEFLQYAAEAGIRPEYQCYPLEGANQALLAIRHGDVRGSRILTIA